MTSSESVRKSRQLLELVPVREYFEVPGKPDTIYEVRDYSKDPEKGAELARSDLPFLFKPFEVGQKPPPSKGQRPPFGREPTIHEYLDWTVTAASNLDSLDFCGFRVLTLLPRYRPNWPPPESTDHVNSGVKVESNLGGPLNPIPLLTLNGKPISAATIRSGNGYLEVPFFATKPSARGKGYGKALLYAIEDICRFLSMERIMLCSTDDPPTISTWQHLGFRHTLPTELSEWGIAPTDLVHMTNTVQMVKMVQEKPKWKSLRIRHEGFDQRIYFEQKNSLQEKQISGKKRKEQIDEQTKSPSKSSRMEVDDVEMKEEVEKIPKNGMLPNKEILSSLWKTPVTPTDKKYLHEKTPDHEANISPQQIHSSKKENTVLGLSSDVG